MVNLLTCLLCEVLASKLYLPVYAITILASWCNTVLLTCQLMHQVFLVSWDNQLLLASWCNQVLLAKMVYLRFTFKLMQSGFSCNLKQSNFTCFFLSLDQFAKLSNFTWSWCHQVYLQAYAIKFFLQVEAIKFSYRFSIDENIPWNKSADPV